jgi:hypothetical protein
VLLREKEPTTVAGLMHHVIRDETLRAQVLETQARAIAAVRAIDFGSLLLDRLAPVLEGHA